MKRKELIRIISRLSRRKLKATKRLSYYIANAYGGSAATQRRLMESLQRDIDLFVGKLDLAK